MKNPFKGRGFQEYKEEVKRREELAEQKRGKLWRFFLKDGEEDVEVIFLTEEPILYYEHMINDGGKWINVTCIGDDCTYCAQGKKPQYRGAFLVVDRREFEVDERNEQGEKTGKTIKVKDRIKIFSRGSQDLAKLLRLYNKYGLQGKTYYVTKIGSGNKTTYEFDRGEGEALSDKQIAKFLEQLPDKYSGMDAYEIVETNIFGEEADTNSASRRTSDNTAPRRSRQDIEDDIDDEVIDLDKEPRKTRKINIKKR